MVQEGFELRILAYKMVQACFDAPWRGVNELRRLVTLPYIRLAFALHGVVWRRGWRVFGMPIIQRYRGSSIELGNQLEMRSWYSTNPLAPNHPVVLSTRSAEAIIEIGDCCGLTGVTIVAAENVRIGDCVTIGANATVMDTDFHPLHPEDRFRNPLGGKHRPVFIEDDVFIGMNSIVLKGVTVGRGSVIGAGSVVSCDVPSGAIAAGNPARVVGQVEERG